MHRSREIGRLALCALPFQYLSRMTVVLSNRHFFKEVESAAHSGPGQKKHLRIQDIDRLPIIFILYRNWRAYRAGNMID
jgi:hypothetical protein